MFFSPFPVNLDPPGRRVTTGSLQNRDAARLLAIVAEHHLRGVARYRPHDITGDGHDETFCNVYSQDICEAMGVMLPRNKRINDLILWLATNGREHGWEQADSSHTAQRMADEGQVALATWFNRNGASGHVAVLVPSLGEDGVWVSQAGRTCFTRGPLAAGFGQLPVTYFVHP